MQENLPDRIDPKDLAANTNVFTQYLQSFGLPTDNIIATTEERAIVGNNLPSLLATITDEEKKDARYLSKFIGATAIGLFDAGLNFIWNEVVLNLRKKAVVYGIDLFYDAAVGGKNREYYKDEDDLDGLKDAVLLVTCLKLELISEIVHKKLDHILTMRNEVAASHPNVESIGGFELLGWLQTCVKDVLQDKPSESAIRIKSLVDNIKSRTDVLDDATVSRFSNELKNLSLPHVHNLLITLFGIFSSENTNQILRANVALISPHIWECADDKVRYRIGITIDGYRTNLQQDKLLKGIEFLSLVDGLRYETLPAREVALSSLADRLETANGGYDNYYHEPPIMSEILQYCKDSTDIPKEVILDLVKAVLRCRLGRGLSYKEGVSPGGLPLYDKFLGMLDDKGITNVIISLYLPEINPKLTYSICKTHLKSILNILRPIAVSDRLKQVIDFLDADIENAHIANKKKEFRQLSSPLIKWP